MAPKPRKALRRMSEKRLAQLGGKAFSTIVAKPSKPKKKAGTKTGMMRRPIAKVGKQKAKRQARNSAYYKSAEWRAKRKAVFERDGFRCTEQYWIPRPEWEQRIARGSPGWAVIAEQPTRLLLRCPNRGEIVNGKQTARGLVCEETSYRHRGVPDYIDTCKTRCKDCDRRLTPLERANHAQGFAHSLGRA